MENLLSRAFFDSIYTTLLSKSGKGHYNGNKIIKFDKAKGTIESGGSTTGCSNIYSKEFNLSLTFARILTNPADLLSVFLILLYLSQTHFPKFQKIDGDYEAKCPLVSLKIANISYEDTLNDHVKRNVTFINIGDDNVNTLNEYKVNPKVYSINNSVEKEVLILKNDDCDDIIYLNEPDEKDYNPNNLEDIEEEKEDDKEIKDLLGQISKDNNKIEDEEMNNEIKSSVLIHKYKFTYGFCKRLFDIFLTISLSITFISSFLELLIMFATQYLCQK
uniref:Tub domain-containing protein n=1 Tax=Parastrongyloides trichosuri TaxID=131310 RepID=A0A0N4Z3I7_PARTI